MAKPQKTESGIAAFYLPIWLDETPPPESLEGRNLLLATQEVFAADLEVGVRVKVSREGYFVFDFAGHSTGKPRDEFTLEVLPVRARFMNLVVACLQTEFFQHETVVEPLFIDYTTMLSPATWILNPAYAASELGTHYKVERHRRSLTRRRRIPVEWVQRAVAVADEAALAGDDRALLAEMILHSFALYGAGQMEASLVTAWTVAERCLNELWDQYIRQQEGAGITDVSRSRRKNLNGIGYTASVMAEVLSLAGELPHEAYEQLSVVRRKRNAWVHKLASIDSADATSAIVLAQAMLRAAKLIDLQVPFYPIATYPLHWEDAPE